MEIVAKVYRYAQPNMTLIGWMGFLGFPAYYYVWQYMFPQDYENLTLRLVCSVLFAGLALRQYAPKFCERYLPYYYLITVGVGLPFFFSYMMFKNDWSTVWAMSLMSACFLHILLVHQTSLILAQAVLSAVVAFFAAYGLDIDQAANEVVWAYVPIFAFTYIFGNLCYSRNQVEHETKVSIAKAFGASIAHEMRNPLSALKATLEVLQSIIPNVKTQNRNEYTITKQEIELARNVLKDADEVIRSGNETIDLLLTSIDENRISNSSYRKYSAKNVVEHAIDTFSYQVASDRQFIHFNVIEDFEFFGSDTLAKFTLFNLMKNAFYYRKDNDFRIDITIDNTENGGQLFFCDNGVGIAEEIVDHVFKDFYTFGKNGSFGLGLPFCKKVMNALGGDITCESEVGEWTNFRLDFPLYGSEQVQAIKAELMKAKTIAYVGSDNQAIRTLKEQSFYQAFKFYHVSVEEAVTREEYEFEFDVIMIDLDERRENVEHFDRLQQKLTFTEGTIVHLFDESQQYPQLDTRYVAIHPLSKQSLKNDVISVIDALVFEGIAFDAVEIPSKPIVLGKTIVIADDNLSLRGYTSILLEKQGFKVVQVSDGSELLANLEHQSADLILMDIEMPYINGITAASAIRSSVHAYSTIPIIGYTGDSAKENIEQIMKAGMNDYIIKPAETKQLLDKIANWV